MFMCMWYVYACLYCAGTCLWMHVEAWGWNQESSSVALWSYSSKQDLWLNQEFSHMASLPSQLAPPSKAGITGRLPRSPSIYVVSGDPNGSPCFLASTLTTKLSFTPIFEITVWFFFIKSVDTMNYMDLENVEPTFQSWGNPPHLCSAIMIYCWMRAVICNFCWYIYLNIYSILFYVFVF